MELNRKLTNKITRKADEYEDKEIKKNSQLKSLAILEPAIPYKSYTSRDQLGFASIIFLFLCFPVRFHFIQIGYIF